MSESRLVSRSDADFAIEFGEYLAVAAESYLNLLNDLWTAEEHGTPAQVEAAEEARSDHANGLRSSIYEFRKRAERAIKARSEKPAIESRWIPTTERQPDIDGRLWAILVTRVEDGRHIGYIPLYEYYYFTNGWATDDTVTHWLDCSLHPLPKAPK